jgi:hypothetical protein
MRFTFSLPLLLAMLAPLSGNTATDGRPGLHSSGQIFIRLQFNQNVQVSKLRAAEIPVIQPINNYPSVRINFTNPSDCLTHHPFVIIPGHYIFNYLTRFIYQIKTQFA